MIRIQQYILTILSIAIAMTSCKDFSLSSYVKGNSIASVGDKELYFEDLKSIFTPGISPEDSINIQSTYVNSWVKKQLKITIAEDKFSDNEKDIEKMVEDYRNALLIHKFESEYIKENMDTLITGDEINEYYKSNNNEFAITSPLLKAVVVKIPVGFRQESKMRELANSGTSDKIQDLIDISIKNNLEYKEFTTWTDYAEVTGLMPRLSKKDYQNIQSEVGFFEVSESGYRYMLVVTDILKEGESVPMEMSYETIKIMILNKRKQDILKTMEDSIYNTALKDKTIIIK